MSRPPPSREELRLRGQLGGLRTSALYDPGPRMEKARRAFAAQFYEGLEDVPEPERSRRAAARRRAYYAELTLKSLKARRNKKAGKRACSPASAVEGHHHDRTAA